MIINLKRKYNRLTIAIPYAKTNAPASSKPTTAIIVNILDFFIYLFLLPTLQALKINFFIQCTVNVNISIFTITKIAGNREIFHLGSPSFLYIL